MLLRRFQQTAVVLVIVFFFDTSHSEECPYRELVAKSDGAIIRDRCSVESNCPSAKFVVNCMLRCHKKNGDFGFVHCKRLSNGTLTTTQTKNILSYFMTTTTQTTLSTTPAPSTSGTNSSARYTILTTKKTIIPTNKDQFDKTKLLIIIVSSLSALAVFLAVGVGSVVWYKHRKTKILPITPSKPRTKPNEPI